MQFIRVSILSLAVVNGFSALSARASEYLQPATILKYYVDINVKENESSAEITYTAKVERDAAINALGNQRISYSPKMQRVDILEAYSIDVNGLKHQIPKDGIKVQDQAVTASAPKFSDYKYKVILFPKVSVGSIVHLKYRKTVFKQLMPRYIGDRYEIFPNLVYKDVQFQISYPQTLTLNVEGRGMKGGLQAVDGGKKIFKFTYRQGVPQEPEIGAVDSSDYSPIFSYSSYKNRIDIGRFYEWGAAPKVEVTQEIEEIVRRETKGLTKHREKIDAPYRWVVKNIRYVSVIMDRSGVIPNHTNEILSRGYGDCKDLTNLLWAMLKAIGIEGSPALINLGNSFNLAGPATIAPFNHVILYVPSEDLYLDATANTVRPGEIYPEIAGKTVVLSSLGKMGRTPDITPKMNTLSAFVDLNIDTKGYVKGRAIEKASGSSEVRMRDWALASQSSSMKKNVISILSDAKEHGEGSYEIGDPLDLSKPLEVDSKFTLEPQINLPGIGGWRIPKGLITSVTNEVAFLKTAPVRKTPFYCQSGTYSERYKIKFPSSLKIISYPSDTSYEGKYITYHSRYNEVSKNVYEVERVSVRKYGKSVCGDVEYGEFSRYQDAIKNDLRAQFLIQAKNL